KKLANAECGFGLREIGWGDVVAGEVVLREIEAAKAMVFGDIANDVGKLEGKAEFFGEIEGTRIAEAENVRASEANGAGHAVAILLEARKGGVGADGEVHFGTGDEVVQIARRHVVSRNGVSKRGEDFRAGESFRWGSHCGVTVEDLVAACD